MPTVGLEIEIAQKQILSQRMLQSMEILQMNSAELDEYIENLALENPVIDTDSSDWSNPDSRFKHEQERAQKFDWLERGDRQNKSYYQQDRSALDTEGSWHDSREDSESLSDYLLAQLIYKKYSDEEREIIGFLVNSLDSKGYFTEDFADVSEYLKVPEYLIDKLLKDIQALEPAGVGARNLKECLLLQFMRDPAHTETAEKIVRHHLTDMAKNHLGEIARKLKVSMDEVLSACDEIRELNPKPGNSFNDREYLNYVTPDALIMRADDDFEIIIRGAGKSAFTINTYYQEVYRDTKDPELKKYLKEKLEQAKSVSGYIEQRETTLSRLLKVLTKKQREFFKYGKGHKRPLSLADIAKELDLHESTVSRAMKGKYLQCDFGVFPLNYFLTKTAIKSEGLGDSITPEEIKAEIQKLIDAEDKTNPLSDQAISNGLKTRGINISRRTVNKYRTEMNIPDKSGRKIWG